MAVLENLGKLLASSRSLSQAARQATSSSAGTAIGRAMSTFTESIPGSRGRRIAVGAGLGGLMMAGMYKETAQPTIKAAMDVAFDDPNADRAVLGTDLTGSILAGGTLDGPIGGLARGSNPYRFYGAPNPLRAAVGSSVIGAGAGALLGAKLRKKNRIRCNGGWSSWWNYGSLWINRFCSQVCTRKSTNH